MGHLAAVLVATTMVLCTPLLLGPPAAHARDSGSVIRGQARVVDGDTLVIGEARIRLFGVDAPEKAQLCKDARGSPYACGLVSKDALLKMVGVQEVTCKPQERDADRYGRAIAVCSTTRTRDLNGWLVENGLAVAYREYSKAYVAAEDAARAAKLGIWKGTFEYPAQWRKEHRNDPSAPEVAVPYTPPPPPMLAKASAPAPKTVGKAADADGCTIKGNINSNKDRIYHMPGSASYEMVKIEPAKGEKFFCSEDEAAAAGFRPAGAPAK